MSDSMHNSNSASSNAFIIKLLCFQPLRHQLKHSLMLMATIQNPSAQSHALIITHYHKIAFVITQSGCKRPLLQSLRTDMHSIKQILKANLSRSRKGYTNRKQTYNRYFPPTLYALF